MDYINLDRGWAGFYTLTLRYSYTDLCNVHGVRLAIAESIDGEHKDCLSNGHASSNTREQYMKRAFGK